MVLYVCCVSPREGEVKTGDCFFPWEIGCFLAVRWGQTGSLLPWGSGRRRRQNGSISPAGAHITAGRHGAPTATLNLRALLMGEFVATYILLARRAGRSMLLGNGGPTGTQREERDTAARRQGLCVTPRTQCAAENTHRTCGFPIVRCSLMLILKGDFVHINNFNMFNNFNWKAIKQNSVSLRR